MVNLLRVAIACFLLLAGLPVHALVSAQSQWTVSYGGNTCTAGDPVAAAQDCFAQAWPGRTISNCRIISGGTSGNYAGGYCHQGQYDDAWGASKSAASCPANSTAVTGGCACAAGFVEVNGQCREKKSDKCGELEGHSLGLPQMEISVGVVSNRALAGMIGKPGTSCFPGGCTVSGGVNGCVSGGASGAVCFG